MISIIVPIYNVEKFLERCIISILEQKYTDYELILVDDGSTDGSSRICDEYAKKDSRIKVIHKENGGLSSARNSGTAKSSGDYLFFIDSDDWLVDQNVLSDLFETLQNSNADFSYGLFNNANDIEITKRDFNNRYYNNDKLFLLSNSHFFSAWNKLFKKDLCKFLIFTEGRINEDLDILPYLISNCKKISFLRRATYNYYQNPNSITRRVFSEKRFDMFLSVNNAYKTFYGNNIEKQIFYENLFGYQLFSLFIEIVKNTKGMDRKRYMKKYVESLQYYKFPRFFHYSLSCFIKNEKFVKRIKKIPLLLFLFICTKCNIFYWGIK